MTIVIRVTEKVNVRVHCPASCTLRIGLQKYDRDAQAPFVSQPFPLLLSAHPPSPAMMGTAGDPTYPLFPLFSFLAFLAALVPLKWNFQASNTGVCAYMLWTSAACLNGFINSLVWHGKMHNPSPAWCDICTFPVFHETLKSLSYAFAHPNQRQSSLLAQVSRSLHARSASAEGFTTPPPGLLSRPRTTWWDTPRSLSSFTQNLCRKGGRSLLTSASYFSSRSLS